MGLVDLTASRASKHGVTSNGKSLGRNGDFGGAGLELSQWRLLAKEWSVIERLVGR
jgi:hypothetical protein